MSLCSPSGFELPVSAFSRRTTQNDLAPGRFRKSLVEKQGREALEEDLVVRYLVVVDLLEGRKLCRTMLTARDG